MDQDKPYIKGQRRQPTNEQFPFKKQITGKFEKWTGLRSPEIEEALMDLTGDTYFEMRKLISICLEEVERMIAVGKYDGYRKGQKLTEKQKESMKDVKEDFKTFLRKEIQDTWRVMLKKQRLGIDKMGLALKPYIKKNEEN